MSNKEFARSIQAKLNIGYMKALQIAEKIETIRDTQVDKSALSAHMELSDSYFLPLACLSNQWVITTDDQDQPLRWFSIYNRDIYGNFLRPITDPEEVYYSIGVHFNLEDGSFDDALASFDRVTKMLISGGSDPFIDTLCDLLTEVGLEHTAGPEEIHISLSLDIPEKVATIKLISELIERNIDWSEYGSSFAIATIDELAI